MKPNTPRSTPDDDPNGARQNPAQGSPAGHTPTNGDKPGVETFAGQYAARTGVRRNSSGHIDVLGSVGGIRGLAESILPGLVFTVIFTVNRDLQLSLAAAVAVAAVFAVARLAARSPLTQAVSGLVGVAICAFVAMRTGNAEDFFLPGFFTNGAYIAAMLVSLAVRWPIAGLLFGFIRGEGLEWRRDAQRVKAYSVATWLIIAVLALRLAVQLPLYFAENVAALGTTRLIMGLPLYALGLWLGWLVSRPAGVRAAE